MQLTHQGRLIDTSGLPYDGLHDVEVLLYDGAAGPSVWSEIQSIDFDNGYFAVQLGTDTASNPLNDTLFDGDLLVAVGIDGGAPGPRQEVDSVPFAVRARSVAGGVVDATEIAINGTTVIDSSGAVVADIAGATLEDLTCNPSQVPIFDGIGWDCVDASSGAGTIDWSSVTGKPFDFADNVDNDALSFVICTDGQGIRWDGAGTVWTCHDFLTESDVDAFVADNGFAIDADLEPLAKSGDWGDINNVPGDIADGDDDLLSTIACADGEGIVWNTGAGQWDCRLDLDTDPANEFQTITRNGVDVSLSDGGGSVNIEDGDASSSNEVQQISRTGSDIVLNLGGGTASINDADADANNERQTLTFAGGVVTISNGGSGSGNSVTITVTGAMIQDGTVDTADLANDAVTAAKIEANAVGASEIAAGAVGSSEVSDNSLTASDLGPNSVGSSEITNGSVSDADMASMNASKLTYTTPTEVNAGCGDFVPATICPTGSRDLRACTGSTPVGSFCEYDSGCAGGSELMDNNLDNCPGSLDVYVRTD